MLFSILLLHLCDFFCIAKCDELIRNGLIIWALLYPFFLLHHANLYEKESYSGESWQAYGVELMFCVPTLALILALVFYWPYRPFGSFRDINIVSFSPHVCITVSIFCSTLAMTNVQNKTRTFHPPSKVAHLAIHLHGMLSTIALLFLTFAYLEGSIPYLIFPLWILANTLFVRRTYALLWINRKLYFPNFATNQFRRIHLNSIYALDFVQMDEEPLMYLRLHHSRRSGKLNFLKEKIKVIHDWLF